MNPPIATRPRTSRPGSIHRRRSAGRRDPVSGTRPRPGLRRRRATISACRARRELGLVARSPSAGRAIFTASPRLTFSRSSRSVCPTAAASQGRSAGDLAISRTTRSSSSTGISCDLGAGPGGGLVQVAVHQDDGRGPLERRLAGQHLVDQDAQRVQVGLVADLGGPADLLGGHVGGRPQGPPGGRQGGGVEVLGDPEVGQLDLALAGDHQVRRLEVAVDHAVLVRVVQRVADLDGQVDHLAPGERPALLEDVVEGHPVDVLHREVRGPLVPAEGQEADDVGVAELLEDLGLAA